MTVGSRGRHEGVLLRSVHETAGDSEGREITFRRRYGPINADLSAGANVAGAKPLRANEALSNRGVIPHGAGFIVTPEQAQQLGLGQRAGLEAHIRPYRNGRDITQKPRGVMVIDAYPLERHELKMRYPEVYQWLHDRVKPDRDQQRDRSLREGWWLHRRNNADMRESLEGLSRYIVTLQTAKHRFFTFLGAEVLPDDKLIAIALEDAFSLGVLSSRLHVLWALQSGSRLGVGNDSVYNKSSCFEAFPFPLANEDQIARIRDRGERIDAHRAHQQAEHPKLTLTGLYNVLEKERAGEYLTEKERTIHEQGLVSVLAELHDELDHAVLDAYGWGDLSDAVMGLPGGTTPTANKPDEQAEAEDTPLDRLVTLNTKRAAKEAHGHVRWLRPEYQAPDDAKQAAIETSETITATESSRVSASAKIKFPKSMVERVQSIRSDLADGPQTVDQLTARYKRKPRKGVEDTLHAVAVAGMAYEEDGLWRLR